jgi:hypothetical protein
MKREKGLLPLAGALQNISDVYPRVIAEQACVEAVRSPVRSLYLSPNLERFMRSVKEECLARMILFGLRSVKVALAEFSCGAKPPRAWQPTD